MAPRAHIRPYKQIRPSEIADTASVRDETAAAAFIAYVFAFDGVVAIVSGVIPQIGVSILTKKVFTPASQYQALDVTHVFRVMFPRRHPFTI